MVSVSSQEVFETVWAVLARAGRQPNVWEALEVSSFAFMHSNHQRRERDRTNFVMGDSNFQDTNVRRTGTPRAAATDMEVPSGAT